MHVKIALGAVLSRNMYLLLMLVLVIEIVMHAHIHLMHHVLVAS